MISYKDIERLASEILLTSPANVVGRLKQIKLKPNEGLKGLFYLLRVHQRSDSFCKSRFVYCYRNSCYYSNLEKDNQHQLLNVEYGNFSDFIENKGECDILVFCYEFTKI